MAKLSGRFAGFGLALALGAASPAKALSPETDASGGMRAFAAHCFSPFLTAAKAADVFNYPNLNYQFYDLDPFSDVAPSPVKGRAATPGTDRLCEVSFFGDFGEKAAEAAKQALKDEGILTPAKLPPNYTPTPTTTLLAARQLNPRRVAVVHVGTRAAPSGKETFMSVERLVPLDN